MFQTKNTKCFTGTVIVESGGGGGGDVNRVLSQRLANTIDNY